MAYLLVVFHAVSRGQEVNNTQWPRSLSIAIIDQRPRIEIFHTTTGSCFMPTKFWDGSSGQNACHRARADTRAKVVLEVGYRLPN